MQDEWFGTWFDSPYYHTLYKHRDYVEAQYFIDNLSDRFQFNKTHKILDLACGKGRHSIYLNKKGFDVEGADLSEQNILHANQFENDRLHFAVHDIREVYKPTHFNFILNLFTSFGYFSSDKEHQEAIAATASSLKTGGTLIIDFFNTHKVLESLVEYSEVQSEGILFKQSRQIVDGTIVKSIDFSDNNKAYHYEERVKALFESDFLRYFKAAGLVCEAVFGSYDLQKFSPETSDRMILVAKKEVF